MRLRARKYANETKVKQIKVIAFQAKTSNDHADTSESCLIHECINESDYADRRSKEPRGRLAIHENAVRLYYS